MSARLVTVGRASRVQGMTGADLVLPIGAADGDQITITNEPGAAQTIQVLVDATASDRVAVAPGSAATFTWAASSGRWSAL